MNKKKTIFGVAIMVAFGSLLLMNFGEQVGGYMNFEQAAVSGQRAHVVGEWVRDNHFQYDPASNTFSFLMKDDKGSVRKVLYNNPKPPNFEDAETVVVEGSMDGDVFRAEHILVKCPSKYNDTRSLEAAG
ncbi:MAG TPA: cytochrome c maturation protein CcmE [Rhodothermia bacterium]|nr:cytochrome c maturation protein CcmE [Rhodothermia bacterium]